MPSLPGTGKQRHHESKINLQNYQVSVLQQPKNTKQIVDITKQVIEKKTKEIILMLWRPRVNPYTKCKVIQPESPEGCDEMRAKERGSQMVKGEEEKG